MLEEVQDETMMSQVREMLDEASQDPYFNQAFSDEYVPGQGLQENVRSGIVVSLDKSRNIRGCFIYEHFIRTNKVTNVQLFNFTRKPGIVFARDMVDFFGYMFNVLKAHKVGWLVNVGTDREVFEDKIAKEYGGRIVGIYKDDAVSADGVLHDVKAYEVMRSDFIKHEIEKEERKEKHVRNHQG